MRGESGAEGGEQRLAKRSRSETSRRRAADGSLPRSRPYRECQLVTSARFAERNGRGREGERADRQPVERSKPCVGHGVMNNLCGGRLATHAVRLRFVVGEFSARFDFHILKAVALASSKARRRDQRPPNGKARRGFADQSCWGVCPATVAQFGGRGGPTFCWQECRIVGDIAKLGKKSRCRDKGSYHCRAKLEAKSHGLHQPSDRLPYAFLCRSLAANSRGRVSRL